MSLFFLIVIAAIGWLLYTLYLKQLLNQGKAGQFKLFIIVLGLIFLALAVTGRAPALFAFLGAAMTLLMRYAPLVIRFAPFLKRFLGGSGAFSGSTGRAAGAGASTVSTATLTMTLDQASGAISGEVNAGDFAGRQISSLSLAELQALYQYCSDHDAEALRLLQAYITRERSAEWQQATGGGPDDQPGNSAGKASAAMTLAEARQILGLGTEYTRKTVMSAHRSLMGRFHPDKGGNDYLATKINTARDILLDHITHNK